MKVVIVGCGWLGKLVATELFSLSAMSGQSITIYGSARSTERLLLLPETIKPLMLDLSGDIKINDNLFSFFSNAIVIVAIPPGKAEGNNYLQSLSRLSGLMQQTAGVGCIHFSSTGVYQGLEGDTDETALPDLTQERVKLLVSGEQLLQQVPDCITLRLAGLMGPGRYPGRFIQGKVLPAPYQPVNMIHATDIGRAVWQILQRPFAANLYNLCCPQLTERQAFYNTACRLAGLPAPVFADDNVAGRRVIAAKFCSDYIFSYRYPSASDALSDC